MPSSGDVPAGVFRTRDRASTSAARRRSSRQTLDCGHGLGAGDEHSANFYFTALPLASPAEIIGRDRRRPRCCAESGRQTMTPCATIGIIHVPRALKAGCGEFRRQLNEAAVAPALDRAGRVFPSSHSAPRVPRQGGSPPAVKFFFRCFGSWFRCVFNRARWGSAPESGPCRRRCPAIRCKLHAQFRWL